MFCISRAYRIVGVIIILDITSASVFESLAFVVRGGSLSLVTSRLTLSLLGVTEFFGHGRRHVGRYGRMLEGGL